MNASNDTNDDNLVIGPGIRGLIAAYVIIGIIAFLGNALVLDVLRTQISTRKNVGFMFANMAVADLLTAIIIIPRQVTLFFTDHHWLPGIFGVILCKVTDFAFFTSIAASILTLTVMSLDRFVGIMLPPSKQIELFHRVKIVTPFIWIASMVMMSPVMAAASSSPSKKNPDAPPYCRIVWGTFGDLDLSQQIFYPLLLIFLYAIPLLLMTSIYSAICYKLWIHKTPGELIVEVNQRMVRKNRRIIRMLIIVVVVFAACWLPPHILHIYMAFYWKTYNLIDENIVNALFFIGQANSAINPCLYIALNTQFRKATVEVLHLSKFSLSLTSRRQKSQTAETVKTTRLTNKVQDGNDNVKETVL